MMPANATMRRAETRPARSCERAMTEEELRALIVRGEDQQTLAGLYDELVAVDGGRPDPARRMLLGRIAEFLERPADALAWYRGVPGGPERAEARISMRSPLRPTSSRSSVLTGLAA